MHITRLWIRQEYHWEGDPRRSISARKSRSTSRKKVAPESTLLTQLAPVLPMCWASLCSENYLEANLNSSRFCISLTQSYSLQHPKSSRSLLLLMCKFLIHFNSKFKNHLIHVNPRMLIRIPGDIFGIKRVLEMSNAIYY